MTSAISIEHLCMEFGEPGQTLRALDEVSLEIRANEFFTLLGPSGCGKTTLLRLIAGFLDPSRGSIAIDGAPRRYVYQGVHMMMDSDWGVPWKAGEKRSSKLVFIGRNLDGDNLKRGFEDCLK